MATARRAAEQHQRGVLAPAAPRVDLRSLSIEFDAWSSRRQRSLNEVFVRTSRRRSDKNGSLPSLPQPVSSGANSGVGADQSRLTRYTWRNYAQTSWFRQFPDMVYKSAVLSQRAPIGGRLVPDARRLTPTRPGASREAAAFRPAPRPTYRTSELLVRSLAGARATAVVGHPAAGRGPRPRGGGAPAPTAAIVFFVGSRFSTLPLARPLPCETAARSRRSRTTGGGGDSARSQADGSSSPRTYKSVASYRRIVESASVERRPPTEPLHCTRQTSAAGASRAEGEEAIINAMEALNFPAEPDMPEWALRESRLDDGAAAEAAETSSGGPSRAATTEKYVRGGVTQCDADSCDEDDGGSTFLLTVAVTKAKC